MDGSEVMTELELLKLLEKRTREMMEFTGWDDNVDDDAALTVRNVKGVLGGLDTLRMLEAELAK